MSNAYEELAAEARRLNEDEARTTALDMTGLAFRVQKAWRENRLLAGELHWLKEAIFEILVGLAARDGGAGRPRAIYREEVVLGQAVQVPVGVAEALPDGRLRLRFVRGFSLLVEAPRPELKEAGHG